MTPDAPRLTPHDPPVIAIDGPSGVGKGMLSRHVARRLGWHRLDSGALYRILALAAARSGVALDDPKAVAALAPLLDIRFVGETEADERILVGGEDWTRDLRLESTGTLASRIAAAPAVRAALLQRQRAFRVAPGLVADGRDMGTVVFTDAPLKLFIVAGAEERARRRQWQLSAMGSAAIFADLLKEIRARDERDRIRSVAPTVPAEDAIVIDTSPLSVEDITSLVDRLIEESGLSPAQGPERSRP